MNMTYWYNTLYYNYIRPKIYDIIDLVDKIRNPPQSGFPPIN